MQKNFVGSFHIKYSRTPFLLNKISLKFYEKSINMCPCVWAVELGMVVETARQRHKKQQFALEWVRRIKKKLWYFSMYIERILDLTVFAKKNFSDLTFSPVH